MTARPRPRAIALAAVVSLIGAACTGGGPAVVTPTAPPPTTTNSPSTTPTPTVSTPPFGGDVTFGAEGWPDCLNPITACADNAWTFYSVLEHVLPRAMQVDPKGNFVPSPLLIEAPSLTNGDLLESPFTVTFKIRPEAVWEDGSPITAADFDFTWRAILGTSGAIRTAGYDKIESIDTTDPSKAVIRFISAYADWADLFGGAFGIILKKGAFSQQVGLYSSLRFAMLESIPFSGGPFVLNSWTRDRAILVRNARYYGPRANFDSVTFLRFADQNMELQTLLSGQVSALYVDSIDPELWEYLGPPAVKGVGSKGTDYEALWFDPLSAPLDDPKVREALMYAIDRQAIIDQVVKFSDPDSRVLNCGFLALPKSPWCQINPFTQFTYDPERAKSILRNDGYDCSAVPCTKNGDPLQLGFGIFTKLWGRTTTRDLILPKALEAGFKLSAKLEPAVRDAPVRTSPDPSISDLFVCDEQSIPGSMNFSHWCDPAATLLIKQSDEELDPTKRLALLNRVYTMEATDFIGLPLYALPKISFWRTDQIDGPVAEYSSSVYGLFFNMNEWYTVAA